MDFFQFEKYIPETDLWVILNQVVDVINLDDELSLFYNEIKTEVVQEKDLIDFKFLHRN